MYYNIVFTLYNYVFRLILAPKAAEILARVKFRSTYAQAIFSVILYIDEKQPMREFRSRLQCCCCCYCYYYCYYIHYYTHKHTLSNIIYAAHTRTYKNNIIYNTIHGNPSAHVSDKLLLLRNLRSKPAYNNNYSLINKF